MADSVQPSSAAPADEPGGGEGVYRSLYRRFRPQRFEDVKGQEHVTLALRNAVRDGRVTHAYLFSGPRGTGKTSTARILARALNCAAPEDGEPCGRCDSCRAIAAGASFDVHELDAASTNGVDAMRDLVARAALATPGRWKVYIVDEVHMLTTAASNALLKTLEEPPDHVVFVLATTDPQKVLPTIRSRAQHYEFHLLADDVLAPLLAEVAATAALALPDGGLAAALRQGRGSARDALSALDQVAAGGVVTDDEAVLGRLVEALAGREVAGVLGALDEAVRTGRDPQQLAVDLVGRLRRAFFLLAAPSLRPEGALPPEAHEQDTAAALGTARIVRAMEVLGGAVVDMREAPDPRVTLEVALVRLSHPEADTSPAAILERLERLERRIVDGPASRAVTPPPTPPPPTPPPPTPPPPTPPPPTPPPPTPPAADPPPQAAPVADPPPPGARQQASRPALGAYRSVRAGPDGLPVTTPPPAATPPSPTATPPSGQASEAAAAPPGAGGARAAPTRDELVAAWGDHVLVGLRPKVRAIYQAGRFVDGGTEGASFALPNEAHLVHAEPLRAEVAEALGRHFGGDVALHLVVEPGPVAPPIPSGAAPSPAASAAAGAPYLEDPEDHVVDDDARGEPSGPGAGITWAEDRLRRAFPGAEEVSGP